MPFASLCLCAYVPMCLSEPAPRTNAAYSCIMHVHTRMSSGSYRLPELTRIAKEQGVDAIFLSDNLVETIEFGLPFFRHIFWGSHRQIPSVLSIGWQRCLDEIRKENKRQSDVLYIPGVEVCPRFFWSGSLLKTNLVCHNHQRDLVVIGTGQAGSLVNLPAARGFLPGRDTLWIILTRLLVFLFVCACLGLLFLPRRLARRSGYPAGMIRRAFLFGLVLPILLVMVAVNLAASLAPSFDIYSPDDPERFEQRVLDALKKKNLMCFWAHPEAFDHNEYKYFGVPFAIDTRPYPEVLLKTKGYTGFAGVNEGENKFVDPGSVWDMVLMQFIEGKRDEPPWCFGEMLYHYEGQSDKKLSNVETVVWAPEKTAGALLDSVRRGFFYARNNFRGQALNLDQWQANGAVSGEYGRPHSKMSSNGKSEMLNTKSETNLQCSNFQNFLTLNYLVLNFGFESFDIVSGLVLRYSSLRASGIVEQDPDRNYVSISLRVSARLPGEAAKPSVLSSDLSGVALAKTEAVRAKGEALAKEGEKAEVLVIRNGAVIKKDSLPVPFDMEISDSLPPAVSKAYYRAVVSGKYPLRLVTNPIFVQR